MRRDIETAISSYLDHLPKVTEAQIPDHLQEPLVDLADFTAKTRSHVARDRSGAIQYLPEARSRTRLGKELGKRSLALAAIRRKPQPDELDFSTVARVAADCLPPNRTAVLNALRGCDSSVGPSDLKGQLASWLNRFAHS